MMGKIVKGKSFRGCVNYILDRDKQTILLDTQGVRLKSKAFLIRSFVTQAKLNPGLGISVGHISLNFSAQDKSKLSDEFIVKVTREYMQKMGIVNTQYILAKHFDKEHPHVHLCFNRVDNNGKTISDRNDRRRNTDICRKLTEKHGLYISSGKENVKVERLREPDKTRYEIYHILNDRVPKCKNWQELLTALNKQGIDVKFKHKGKTSEIQGITFTRNGYSFTGSKVDRMFSYSKIDYQLKQNNQPHSHSLTNSNNNQSQWNQQNQSKGIIESAIDALSGMSVFQPHGDDYEENAFRNRLEYEEKARRKKKKGVRR